MDSLYCSEIQAIVNSPSDILTVIFDSELFTVVVFTVKLSLLLKLMTIHLTLSSLLSALHIKLSSLKLISEPLPLPEILSESSGLETNVLIIAPGSTW